MTEIIYTLRDIKIHPVIQNASSIVVLLDRNVKKYYSEKINNLFSDFFCHEIIFTATEKNKSRQSKEKIENKLARWHCDRNTVMIGVGGGITGDVAGFVAATWMRGISYILIPTTLLSMVDSSIGGKVAVNACESKNLIGAYWKPVCIVIDTQFLPTLSDVDIHCGVIEAYKMFLTCDENSAQQFHEKIFSILNRDEKSLVWLIHASNKIKLSVVNRDFRETEYRKILNFGHTVGHALEQYFYYKIPHGIAVGLGMLVEITISYRRGVLNENDYQKIVNILCILILPSEARPGRASAKLFSLLTKDKKNISGKIHCVLLKKIGEVLEINKKITHVITTDEIKTALALALPGRASDGSANNFGNRV